MRRIVYAILLGLISLASHALPLLVIEAGQLTGARGVEVDGRFFDVEFKAGSCVAVFDGCDESSDFAFNSLSDAESASAALLAQVFLDRPVAPLDFDSRPFLTFGCGSARLCDAFIPYALETFPNKVTGGITTAVRIAYAANFASSTAFEHDIVTTTLQTTSRVFGSGGEEMYVVWSIPPVREPATISLLSLGLLGVAAGCGCRARAG